MCVCVCVCVCACMCVCVCVFTESFLNRKSDFNNVFIQTIKTAAE